MAYTNKIERAVGREFGKTFTLGTRWPLPNAETMFVEPQWESDGFQRLKHELNATKDRLDSFNLDCWHAHTAKMNPAGLVINHVRKHVHPDFLTQAWCKFYEIACGEPNLVPRDAVHENHALTVHLCEAPGAFVSALNHHLATRHEGLRLEWLAMTLNPYHEANGHSETVTDDRLIRNTMDNWEFGPDYTGDIFQPGYAEHLRRVVAAKGPRGVCLVTADGSVDCSGEPDEQENVVMRLHHYETMVALNVLRDGGSLVLKMFTVFECNTVCRVYLLCCMFGSVVVRKPATSKPGNSEVYLVCTGYRGRSFALPYVRKFFAAGGNNANAMFPSSQVPHNFRTMLLRCATYFSRMQITAIARNIDALSNKRHCYWEMENVKRALCHEFLVRCDLRPIRRDQELIPGGCRARAGTRRGQNGGTSHEEMTRTRNEADLGRVADALFREARTTLDDRLRRGPVFYRGQRDSLTVDPSTDVRLRTGKPVTVVRSSKFCSEQLIRCREQAVTKFPPTLDDVAAKSRTLLCQAKSRVSYYRANFGAHMHVCDVTNVCAAYVTDDATLQRKCLESVMGMLDRLGPGDDLAVVGYPLYTQKAVACFFALAAMFKTHNLLIAPDHLNGHAIAFYGYESHGGWMNVLNAVTRNLASPMAGGDSPTTSSLVSLIPVNVLFKQKAYADIVSFNDLCIAREVQRIVTPFITTPFSN